MATLSGLVTFENGDIINANEMNSNFTVVKNFVETLSAGGNFDAGAINSEDIAAAAIVESKIATYAVTTSKLLNSAITTDKIADGAVTTVKIADGSITSAKLAGGAAIPSSIIDAKGDLVVGTAADTANRLAVGTDRQVLLADSGQTTGLAWASLAGSSNVATAEAITSSTYAGLTTPQTVTLTTGTSAIIMMTFEFTRPAPESDVYMSFAVSGASTIAASDANSANANSYDGADRTITRIVRITNLTPGSNTFTAQFKRVSTNCNAYNRSFTVLAI